ncbi:MAG TPA: tetratricopeptide repeat protein [Methylophilaceae bacterium]|jgi:2-polyprenyl-3-methyl-5-hydroxy-6-metoxy-1,4-benzoquinol methylase/Tfp pilus assembly protein PilF
MSKHPSSTTFVNPKAVQAQLQQALSFHQHGKFAEAEQLYRALLQQAPKHYEALHFYGVLHCQRGQFETALELISEAVSMNPSFPDAHLNRGIALHELRRYDEAVASYDRAIKLKPLSPETFFNRGNTLRVSKRYDEAVASYEKALKLKPVFPQALLNLGNALQSMNRDADALTSYEKALVYQPQYVEALISYSHLQRSLGRSELALNAAMRALSFADTVDTRATFFNIVKSIVFLDRHQPMESLLTRALSEPWGRPYELLTPVISLIKLDPVIEECVSKAVHAWPQRLEAVELFIAGSLEALACSELLLCMLQNCQSCDPDLEKFLSDSRYALLQLAAKGSAVEDLRFFGRLAQQCFINEYVYYSNDAEFALAQRLKDEMEQSLIEGSQVSPLVLLAVASYFPLYLLPTAKQLLDRVWADTINEVLVQQIVQPFEEVKHRSGIARIATIQNEISLSVQHQYEENPYPRWVKYASQSAPMSVDDFLHREFPHMSFHPIGKTADVDILIAGCGTGMQAIDVASNFLGAKVLAVDLSLQSLGYAVRKSHELGLTNIEYAQADILEIGAIGRYFDVVESVGVLHHLKDPFQGLHELVNLLKPGGVMKLGFYSELARSDVVATRKLIAEKGYGANADDIRKLRYEILSEGEAGKFAGVMALRDFYSIGECRDLLFHVQEHRFRIPALRQMLEDCGLQFLGFQLAPHILKRYAERFPEDRTKTDLNNWDAFEMENPATFIAMYQFWVQKRR